MVVNQVQMKINKEIDKKDKEEKERRDRECNIPTGYYRFKY